MDLGGVLWQQQRWGGIAAVQYCLYVYLYWSRLCVRCALHEDQWLDQQMDRLGHIKEYEIIYPRWRLPTKHKRSLHPSEANVVITAEGRGLDLQLLKNEDLFAAGYTETWYSPNGARQIYSPPSTENCFYHGVVEGEEASSVALNNCEGLRGVITINSSVTYLIEPLANHTGSGVTAHAVYRAERLTMRKGTCAYSQDNDGAGVEELIVGMVESHLERREKRDVSLNMKYVELLLVGDHAEYEKHERNYGKTKLKLLDAANYVDKYYKALNIRVALIGLEVWTDQDKISVSQNPYTTLGNFLAWRRRQQSLKRNDNAQLVTGISFQGTTIGLAPLKAMCSEYQSGGVNSDHSDSAVGVAATMAHEMGHNFGMSHDSAGCCQARPEEGGCIMAAATGHPFPHVFNQCNRKEVERYLASGGGKCLFNLPNTRSMYGGQRCGNGYLEEGEECDCGEEEECSSPCCNANNCTLKAGAECAHGVCCHNCKLKSAGVLCRPASGLCDLPEYCDGKSESCPANFYLMDGNLCDSGRAYCYTGMCLTLEQQCVSLWGEGARPAPELCFTKVNEAGDTYGNCGKDLVGKYRRCRERDARCGKIQCLSKASKPLEANAVAIDTRIRQGGNTLYCRGTHVYRADQESDSQGDTLDPGLVMTGTKCGENSICFDGECRNASFLQANDCNAKCHGHGSCNNNHNCHCASGWGPPHCEREGTGGSIDSGPVSRGGSVLLGLLVLPLLLLPLAAGALFYFCRHQTLLRKSPVPPPIHFTHAEDAANGHANPTFQLKRESSHAHGQSSPKPSPSCPPRPRHAIVRPTVKPPPLPAYAAQQHSPHIPASLQPDVPEQSKPRPGPPRRPPPPCPATRQDHSCAPNITDAGGSDKPDVKRQRSVALPAGHRQKIHTGAAKS